MSGAPHMPPTDSADPGYLSGWRRLLRFSRKPWKHQYLSIMTRLQSRFRSLPIPIRLSRGAWYLAGDSELDQRILYDLFEHAEAEFIQRYLQPGMTVLDIGAHHGFYSVIASRAVHPGGAVHSFEPSPRERVQLQRNLRLNRCENLTLHSNALGAHTGRARLFLVQGNQDGCNSLRQPDGVPATVSVEVEVMPLDDFLKEHGLQNVDFLKLDVEGAEFSVLQGASSLLNSSQRPVILAEVSDLRTKAWDYAAREILVHLEQKGFRWFEPVAQGKLVAADRTLGSYDHNLVAVPEEKMERIRPFLRQVSP
jgi:FkbM family methyltransferase